MKELYEEESEVYETKAGNRDINIMRYPMNVISLLMKK